jgi:acyl-CoA synthetase (AMP-forming)/AMP-acid ligase II
MVVAFLAASKSGTVALPLNWRLAPVEWRRILVQGGARLLVSQAQFTAALDEARPPGLDATYIVDGSRDGWQDYRAWLAWQPEVAAAAEGDDRLALYQMYTSGTTGEPKGVVITHHAVLTNAMQAMLVFEPRLSSQDCALIVMPMFHAGAASFVAGALISGARMVIHREFRADALVDALAGGITVANLVPAMLQMALSEVQDVADRDYSHLHTIIYGASPIAEDTLRRAVEVFRCRFYQGYCQTETTACLTMLSHADHVRALAGRPELLSSAGKVLAGTQLRIVDTQGRDLPAGAVGEIVVRGPQLMQGYWNRPDETAATYFDGWLRTGDVGRLDAEGYLYICDRAKDVIISGGENIYPREVENVLFAHPAVADAAVIGIPDAKFGEQVLAMVVLREGATLSGEELVAHCRRHLGGYKLPRRVEFVAGLPRNPSGKVLKKELRAPYWSGHARNVG